MPIAFIPQGLLTFEFDLLTLLAGKHQLGGHSMYKNILETINLTLKLVVIIMVPLVAYWVWEHKAEFEITMIDKETRSKLTLRVDK